MRLAELFAERLLPAALLTLLATLAAGACSGREHELPPPDATYTVRALVRSLPPARGGEMLMEHEAIEEFAERDGTRTGMAAMTMPFTPARTLDLSGLNVGDPVRMTFEVRWRGDPLLRIVKIEKLPPGTKLDVPSRHAGSAPEAGH